MRAKYVAMVNMPGYMPDDDSLPTFASRKACLAHLIGEVEVSFDDASEGYANIERLESELHAAIRHLKKHGYCYFLGYYFGINEL